MECNQDIPEINAVWSYEAMQDLRSQHNLDAEQDCLRFRYSSNKGATRGADNNGGFPGNDTNTEND